MARTLLFIPLFVFHSSVLCAEDFGGIDFPAGAISFADVVVSYDPAFGGGNVPTDPDFTDPAEALGIPDYPPGVNFAEGSVSLGSGGRIVLQFVNNRLTGSGDNTPDLHVFEVGSDVEDTFVEISVDGVIWIEVGKVFGSVSSIDIDQFGFDQDDEFFFVRLTDDPNEGGTSGATVGADIDAVGAISSIRSDENPNPSIRRAVCVEFRTFQGSSYTIESSGTASDGSWVVEIDGIVGDGSRKEYFFKANADRRFFRVIAQ